MKTIDIELLSTVTGGASSDDNEISLVGCYEAAEKLAKGSVPRETTLKVACEKEYIRNNFPNFKPSPGYSQRRPVL